MIYKQGIGVLNHKIYDAIVIKSIVAPIPLLIINYKGDIK